jgi:tellurite resistance protein TehA-like permease
VAATFQRTPAPKPGRAAADGLATLFPGYFSLVMATGIVSIACLQIGWGTVAWALFALNLVAYATLWLLTLARLLWWPRRLLADLVDHQRGPGFFTTVAATAVLGSQVVLLPGQPAAGFALWIAALTLWVLITYGFFVAVVVSQSKGDIVEALSGGWLLAAVATQSLSVLASLVAIHVGAADTLLLAALLFLLLGGMQYLLLIGPIFHRLIFLRLTVETWTPLFWINSGALAITTLAGSRLILGAPAWRFLDQILPFLQGFTLFFWAAATWWIPLLILVGVWRHGLKRYPLAYGPEYWGLVFPLGMYTVCSLQLSQATGLDGLAAVPRVTIWLALLAWTVTFAGLLRSFWRRFARGADHSPANSTTSQRRP